MSVKNYQEQDSVIIRAVKLGQFAGFAQHIQKSFQSKGDCRFWIDHSEDGSAWRNTEERKLESLISELKIWFKPRDTAPAPPLVLLAGQEKNNLPDYYGYITAYEIKEGIRLTAWSTSAGWKDLQLEWDLFRELLSQDKKPIEATCETLEGESLLENVIEVPTNISLENAKEYVKNYWIRNSAIPLKEGADGVICDCFQRKNEWLFMFFKVFNYHIEVNGDWPKEKIGVIQFIPFSNDTTKIVITRTNKGKPFYDFTLGLIYNLKADNKIDGKIRGVKLPKWPDSVGNKSEEHKISLPWDILKNATLECIRGRARGFVQFSVVYEEGTGISVLELTQYQIGIIGYLELRKTSDKTTLVSFYRPKQMLWDDYNEKKEHLKLVIENYFSRLANDSVWVDNETPLPERLKPYAIELNTKSDESVTLTKRVEKRGQSRYSDEEKLNALLEWDNIEKGTMLLEDFLDAKFGSQAGILNIATSTFHGWRSRLRAKRLYKNETK